ncbi:GyrI-like domain-containing protein [Maribacter sp. 2-571]|uniref:GyrI-like domain-containing protein n=1 Tax=Maribacter sp. 2-571 TaxID=3417569 RepID=UPI003D328358
MEKRKQEGFSVIGIKVRTINENGQAARDIGKLWHRFVSENIVAKIPNKISTSVLSIYTNYEKDHTAPYDTILGCMVDSLEDIPEGMVGQRFNDSNYLRFLANGDLSKGVVYKVWKEIWENDFDRLYTADFEVYGEKAQDPTNAEVEIFVAVR